MNKEEKIKIIKGILLGIALMGAVVVVGAMAPNVFQVLGRRKEWGRKKFNRSFNYLKTRKLISIKDGPDESTIIELSEQGKKRILKYKIDDIKITPMKKWDGIWRFVTYDIPDKHRRGSNALSQKLKELGLLKFQKNFWLYPYPVKDEIDFVCEFFNVRRFVRAGEINKLEDDEFFKSKFNLL